MRSFSLLAVDIFILGIANLIGGLPLIFHNVKNLSLSLVSEKKLLYISLSKTKKIFYQTRSNEPTYGQIMIFYQLRRGQKSSHNANMKANPAMNSGVERASYVNLTENLVSGVVRELNT